MLKSCHRFIQDKKSNWRKTSVSMARKKEKDLYYLLPGMARGARQKFLRNLKVSIVVGILVAGVLALLMYYKDKL